MERLQGGAGYGSGDFAAVLLTSVLFKGMLGRLNILVGVVVGYLYALCHGAVVCAGRSGCVARQIDFSAIARAPWFGLPAFSLPQPDFNVLAMFLPVVFVLVAENVGHVKSVSMMTGKSYDSMIGRSLFADGLGTVFAGLGGGCGTTTYAENIGVMAATKVYSTAAYWCAAGFALLLSLSPKFGQLIDTIPVGVLGGVTTLLYGMIGMLGVRIWVENHVDFASPVNLSVASVTMIIGIADFAFAISGVAFNGIAIGSVLCLALYHSLRWIGHRCGTVPLDDEVTSASSEAASGEAETSA